MNTSITLTLRQISLLTQILSEQVSQFQIEPSEQDLAEEVLDILEEAENLLCDIENRISVGT